MKDPAHGYGDRGGASPIRSAGPAGTDSGHLYSKPRSGPAAPTKQSGQPDPLDLVCCPPGTCEHAACEARYLRRIRYPNGRPLRSWPKDPDEDRWPE